MFFFCFQASPHPVFIELNSYQQKGRATVFIPHAGEFLNLHKSLALIKIIIQATHGAFSKKIKYSAQLKMARHNSYSSHHLSAEFLVHSPYGQEALNCVKVGPNPLWSSTIDNPGIQTTSNKEYSKEVRLSTIRGRNENESLLQRWNGKSTSLCNYCTLNPREPSFTQVPCFRQDPSMMVMSSIPAFSGASCRP